MKSARHAGCIDVAGKDVTVVGRFPRVAKLHAEYHECIADPAAFLARLKESGVRADVFTFLAPVSDPVARHDYLMQPDAVAVLHIDTYQKWWKEQISDKTRNMVRKAPKKGVVIRVVEFDDELARGIHAIYDECPMRQGRPSAHYGKDFETIKRAHATFVERSVFIGAYLDGKLIGFIKMILHGGDSASLMQIISMISHRDKAPTNALLGKAVEICAERGIRHLQYGVWSRRSLGDFKKHHGLVRVELPRYFVPLNWRGRLALGMRMHRKLVDFIPGAWQDAFVDLRSRWYSFKYRSQAQV